MYVHEFFMKNRKEFFAKYCISIPAGAREPAGQGVGGGGGGGDNRPPRF